jgi:hypothetical protein
MISKDIAAIAALAVVVLGGMYMGIDSGFSTLGVGAISAIAGYHIGNTPSKK